MPVAGDLGGGGGSWCPVSPSDMVGQINNLMSRIEALEQDLAELKAQNTEAIQLSDLSNSAGWIYDVVYMGMPGWTQTPAGTLIPPADGSFTVSQILDAAQQRDQLNYTGGTGGIETIAQFEGSTVLTSGVPQFTLRYRTDSSISLTGLASFHFGNTGWYMFVLNMGFAFQTDGSTRLAHFTYRDSGGNQIDKQTWTIGLFPAYSSPTGNMSVTPGMIAIFRVTDSAHYVTFATSGFSNGSADEYSWLTIMKIRNL